MRAGVQTDRSRVECVCEQREHVDGVPGDGP